MVLHGFPRLTQDIDFFIKPTEENISKLIKALYSVFNDPAIDEITLDELRRYPVIRYGTPDGFSIDLIVNIGNAFSFEDIRYEHREIEGCMIKIATPQSLLSMKKKTYRAIDQLDVQFLYDKIEKEGGDGSEQTQMTFDEEFNDWFPHVSPDGKWVLMMSYGTDVDSGDHPFYREVTLRLMPAEGGEPEIIAYLYGGQGTINVPSWAPDSKRFSFVSHSGRFY